MSAIRGLVHQLRSSSVPIRRLALTRNNTTQAANKAQQQTTQKHEQATTATVRVAMDSKASKKTQAQLDEEIRQKLASIAGDGGEAGVEYEDGQPVAMKRSVKSNMFRYI